MPSSAASAAMLRGFWAIRISVSSLTVLTSSGVAALPKRALPKRRDADAQDGAQGHLSSEGLGGIPSTEASDRGLFEAWSGVLVRPEVTVTPWDRA
jgi:hypothetical protein